MHPDSLGDWCFSHRAGMGRNGVHLERVGDVHADCSWGRDDDLSRRLGDCIRFTAFVHAKGAESLFDGDGVHQQLSSWSCGEFHFMHHLLAGKS